MKRLLLLLVLLLGIVGGVAAQDDVTSPISPALAAQLDDLEAQVHDLRGWVALHEVERLFPSVAEAQAHFAQLLAEEITPEILREETQFYRAFDFFNPEIDLLSTYTALLQDQVAGYYDSDTDEMNTLLISGDGQLGDSLPLLERTIYVHEYVHALQDQYTDALAAMDEIESPDRILAALALIEGDASLVMQDYLTAVVAENPMAALGLLATSMTGTGQIPPDTPEILVEELMMPYVQGMEFVLALRERGGWDTVNAAYENLPVSSEQILHPQKYIDGEQPVTVELQPTDNLMTATWEPLLERTLGEFYLQQYLSTQLGGRTARAAAAGWGGDLYRIYYDENADEIAWVMRLAWDTEADAAEFDAAYRAFATERTGADEVDRCWEDADTFESLCLHTNGQESIVTSAPDLDIAQALLASQ